MAGDRVKLYRDNARACAGLGALAADRRLKALYVELAEQWEEMAAQAARLDALYKDHSKPAFRPSWPRSLLRRSQVG